MLYKSTVTLLIFLTIDHSNKSICYYLYTTTPATTVLYRQYTGKPVLDNTTS